MTVKLRLRKPVPTVRLRKRRFRKCRFCKHTVWLYPDGTYWDHYPFSIIAPDKLCKGSGEAHIEFNRDDYPAPE